MRTINENRGEIKRVYAFADTDFTYYGEEPENRSCFYAFGIQRQVEFGGYSNEEGSRLAEELRERFLK